MKKVGSAESWLGREMDSNCCSGEGAMVTEMDMSQTTHRGDTQGKLIPIATGLESKRGQIL